MRRIHRKPKLPRSQAHASSITPRLLRRHEAALYLGLSVSAVDALRNQGELHTVPVPAVRGSGVSRVPLYDVQALDAAISRWQSSNGGGRC
jgi:hypothetical protein